MPNKPNKYWTFVMWYQQSKSKDGFSLSRKQAEREAAQIWETMTDSDRRLFEEKAELEFNAGPSRANSRPRPGFQAPKLTKSERRLRNALQEKCVDFERGIENFQQNVFNLSIIRSNSQMFLPCEITIVRWSLELGVINYFHVVCDPEICGDEYTEFRKNVGVKEAIVRIKDTNRSQENREQLRNAMLEFCEGNPLLVPRDQYTDASFYLDNLFQGSKTSHTVLEAEEVFRFIAGRIQNFQLGKDRISREFHRSLNGERLHHLRCSLHRDLSRYGCSLMSALSFAYALSQVFSGPLNINQKPVSHYASPGARPQGQHYSGDGIDEENEAFNDDWSQVKLYDF